MQELLNELKLILNSYSEADTNRKLLLLSGANKYNLLRDKQLITYHDCLLFLMAYPDNNEVLELANRERERITDIIEKYSSNKKANLSGTGLPYTKIICSYSFELSKWLSEKFKTDVDIDSSGAEKDLIRETMRLLFPEPEYWQTTQDELSLNNRLKLLKGKSNQQNKLDWLLKQFNRLECSAQLREYLYLQLKLFIGWELNDKEYTRSYLTAIPTLIYYHKDIIKKVNTTEIVSQKLPNPRKLNSTDRKHLCDVAKTSLAFLYRETDPVTYSDPDEVVYFELDRGISIALYGMKKEKRFSMESYIGYMAYKNGFPVAYGGGWMLGSRCKIGLNIYEPFRGGESAYIFSQVIRVYHQYFGMERFVVKPYQFGKGNPEGIKSGAYWFYYKLGFRSVDTNIAEQASKEWKKISTEKGYRTAEEVLKQLTNCNIELVLKNDCQPTYDASEISRKITEMINVKFGGDRDMATTLTKRHIKKELAITEKLSSVQEMHVSQLSLWFALLQDLGKWNSRDKNDLKEILILKGDDNERNYVLKLRTHRKLWQSMKLVLYP